MQPCINYVIHFQNVIHRHKIFTVSKLFLKTIHFDRSTTAHTPGVITAGSDKLYLSDEILALYICICCSSYVFFSEVSRSASDSGEMDITPREVLEEFKCPVCVEYMTPPIPMCQNGHNICNTCRQKVNRCPTCRQQFSESRCWLLENIIQIMKYRCQYYKDGCEFVSTTEFIKFHEADCPHRPFNCPFSVVVTKIFCWRGHISGMWGHIWGEDTALALPEATKFVFTLDCTGPGPLNRTPSAWDETFSLVFRVINCTLPIKIGSVQFFSYRLWIGCIYGFTTVVSCNVEMRGGKTLPDSQGNMKSVDILNCSCQHINL